MLSVNLNGAYYVTRQSCRLCGTRVGHLIYVSSISGLAATALGRAYQAAKARNSGPCARYSPGGKRERNSPCAICPGLVDTEILEKRPVKPTADILARALRPEDVAEAILSVAKLPPRAVVPEMQILPTYL